MRGLHGFLNNVPVPSCLSLADAVNGEEITTIEALAKGNVLHPYKLAF